MSKSIKLLISHDIDGWCYHRRAMALQRYAPPDFDVTITPFREVPWNNLQDFDCIFTIDYTQAAHFRRRLKHLNITINEKDKADLYISRILETKKKRYKHVLLLPFYTL